MLTWDEILNVVRANKKRGRHQQTSHYFGYGELMEPRGTARSKKLMKLVQYIRQEGECAGCQKEFEFDNLTLDRVKPGKLGGTYELPNVQLMCQPCNNTKDASYSGQGVHP